MPIGYCLNVDLGRKIRRPGHTYTIIMACLWTRSLSIICMHVLSEACLTYMQAHLLLQLPLLVADCMCTGVQVTGIVGQMLGGQGAMG